MAIFVIGISHKTATISMREKAYFAPHMLTLYLQDLLASGIEEAVLLSTCNRSELYCYAETVTVARNWFCAQTSLSEKELASAIYTYSDKAAICHIISVAAGLDSMVLGETQILGHMKLAYAESCAAMAVSTIFHRLFQQVFAVAKELRSTTAIGACPVSVASSAMHFARQRVNNFNDATVVLLGAGETAILIARYLTTHLTRKLIVINRDPQKAQTSLQGLNCSVYGLSYLKEALCHADLLFSATGSTKPLIQHVDILDSMPKRTNSPLMLIDIAVPRDIDPQIKDVPQVELYCIDDLRIIIEQNRRGREHAAEKALALIMQKSIEVITELNALKEIAHTIRAYRRHIELICHGELIKAKQQLVPTNTEALTALDAFATAFTKKLLHGPSRKLRQVGLSGGVELARLTKRLYDIPDYDSELL